MEEMFREDIVVMVEGVVQAGREKSDCGNGNKEFHVKKGESLMDLFLRQGITDTSFCGGKGICGRCGIRFLHSPTMPGTADRRFFKPEELRRGMRLACQSRPVRDCAVELMFQMTAENKVVTVYERSFQPSVKQELSDKRAMITAVDLGTTTIAIQVLEAESGRVAAEYRKQNPQRAFGADIISRMEASISGNRERLRSMIVEVLESGISRLWEETGGPSMIVIAGNTVMEHLLMGQNVKTLASFPFTPVNLGVQFLDILGQRAVLMPGISAFVGADIVAGLFALDFCGNEAVHLFLDLGTNGEMAIGGKERILCTATAAGPAFEGGVTAGIHGADMISIAAHMLERGIMDRRGLLKESYFENGYPFGNIKIGQRDIRNLQMAKAAVHAGIQILLETYGIPAEDIGLVFLAGGFGHYLDVSKANRIGLIPRVLAGKVKAVGNTSLLGAYLYGRRLLEQEEGHTGGIEIQIVPEVEKILGSAQQINLAEQPDFEEIYISGMDFS